MLKRIEPGFLIFLALVIAVVGFLFTAYVKWPSEDPEETEKTVVIKETPADDDESAEVTTATSEPELTEIVPDETDPEISGVEREGSVVHDTAEAAPKTSVLYYDLPLPDEVQDHIFDVCSLYDIPVPIILAMIYRESCFDPSVIGAAGEFGYMQIHPVTAKFIMNNTGLNVYDPLENISAGAWLIHYFVERGYDIDDALICYNEGEGNAITLLNQGIKETAYTSDIFRTAATFSLREETP